MSRLDTALSRRRLLQGLAVTAMTASAVPARASLTVDFRRPGWRYCDKCEVMFDSDAALDAEIKGRKVGGCPAGGAHRAQGLRFRLPYFDRLQDPRLLGQSRWNECRYCYTMFFNGYPAKGRCAVVKAHEADRTFDYVLPHDIPATAFSQTDWRFCTKCNALFFNGYPSKGVCAGGGAHSAAGFVFVLPHTR